MSLSSDVLVIGAGAIGSACAREIARSGRSVTLLQRADTPGEGWRAAAGMLAAQIEATPEDPLFNLALAGRSYYRRNADALIEASGGTIGLLESGILQLAWSDAEVEAGKAKVAWQRQQGYRADWLSSEEVQRGWPWLAPAAGGFWAAEDGALDPAAVVAAFRADAIRHGTQLIHDEALGLDIESGKLVGVIGAAGRYRASAVVVAGGAWAGRLGQLPRPLSVEPVRGQIVAFPWPRGVAPAIVYGPRCYILQRGEELLAGATMEHAGFDAAVTAEGIRDLLARVATVYPPLASATPLRSWAGLRPGTPDGLPIIGPEPRLPGLWYATGHGRNGILLAGITGELIAQGIAGEELPDELRQLRPTRFWNW
ncbi:MAG: glycine oxidase ThiO [Gemmatimonadota bacterium]